MAMFVGLLENAMAQGSALICLRGVLQDAHALQVACH